MRRQEQEKARQEKLFNKGFNKLHIFEKELEEKQKEIEEGIEKRKKEIEEEKQLQETLGVVNRPKKLGKYNYKMKKIEF